MGRETLTPKQQRFVEEYLIDLNGTQAAVRAGYSEKTAEPQASRLLSNVKVAAAVARAQEMQSRRTQVTADKVIAELAKLGFSDMRDFASWGPGGISLKQSDEMTDKDAACVSEVSETTTEHGGSLRFKLHDKKGALELLGKHLGVFVDRVQHEGSIEILFPEAMKDV